MGFESIAAGKVFHQPAYTVRYCGGCGLYFKSSRLRAEDLVQYYAGLDFEPFEEDADFPTDRLLRRSLGGLPAGSRVLDFGCSTGRLLKEWTGRFECFGVEVSGPASAVARDRGIRIVSEDDLRNGALRDFDAIVLADVYEHLPRPADTLVMLADGLKPGGRIAVVTGNGDAVRARDRLAEFWYFQLPGHLHMMSERHARWLAGRINARLVQLHRCSHYALPLARRIKQHLQYSAYYQFRRKPESAMSAVLRRTPIVRRAERWTRPPVLTGTADHFVAIYERQEQRKAS